MALVYKCWLMKGLILNIVNKCRVIYIFAPLGIIWPSSYVEAASIINQDSDQRVTKLGESINQADIASSSRAAFFRGLHVNAQSGAFSKAQFYGKSSVIRAFHAHEVKYEDKAQFIHGLLTCLNGFGSNEKTHKLSASVEFSFDKEPQKLGDKYAFLNIQFPVETIRYLEIESIFGNPSTRDNKPFSNYNVHPAPLSNKSSPDGNEFIEYIYYLRCERTVVSMFIDGAGYVNSMNLEVGRFCRTAGS